MPRIYTYHDLYRHFLCQFYLGVYQKGDRLPTQLELAARYQVATNSVKKVFRMLLEDGFIATDRSFGTHLLFDRENPQHMAKVPLRRAVPGVYDMDTVEIPSRMVAYVVRHCLQLATPQQLDAYQQLVEQDLNAMERNCHAAMSGETVFIAICKDLGNSYISEFVRFLRDEFLYADRQAMQNPQVRSQTREQTLLLYQGMRQVLEEKNYQQVVGLVCRYYRGLHDIPGLMAYAVLDDHHKMFAQQTLYTQLVHRLFLSIVAGNMKKGDLLPTESQLAQQYQTSLITVRKAATVLKEIGLIDGERFVGTRMKEDWDSPAVQSWLTQMLETQRKQIGDAIFTEYVLGTMLCDMTAGHIPEEVRLQMVETLEQQWEGYRRYRAPLFISETVLTPLVNWLDCTVLSHCYFHVHQDLTKFLAVRLLQMSSGFGGTSRVYSYASRGLEALGKRNLRSFLTQIDAAVLLNWDLLKHSLDNGVYRSLQPAQKD